MTSTEFYLFYLAYKLMSQQCGQAHLTRSFAKFAADYGTLKPTRSVS